MRNPYQSRKSKISSLPTETAVERYRHFLKTIVETQSVWGLYQDGWAIGATSVGRKTLPLWNEKSYAQLCQTETWSSYEPAAITVESFIYKMLPYAVKENVLLSIMMTPEGQSVFIEPSKMLMDLKNYLYSIYTTSPDFFTTHPDVPLPRKIRIHAK